jgi:hypothetical protein
VALAKSGTRVTLSWRDNALNETSFVVERSANGGRSWARVGQVGVNVATFVDASVGPRKTYKYRVRAFNGAGPSAYSNTATVITPRNALRVSARRSRPVAATLCVDVPEMFMAGDVPAPHQHHAAPEPVVVRLSERLDRARERLVSRLLGATC